MKRAYILLFGLFSILFIFFGCYGKSAPITNVDICTLAIDSVLPKFDEIEKNDTIYMDLFALLNMGYDDKCKVISATQQKFNHPAILIDKRKVIEKNKKRQSGAIQNGFILEVNQYERVSPSEVTAIVSIIKTRKSAKSYETILKYRNNRWICECVKEKWMN